MHGGPGCQKTLIISLGMHEGAAAPSYLRPGLGLRRGFGSQTTFANLQPRKARPSKSAAAACTQQGWKPFGLPSRLRRPRTAKSKILTPRRWSGPSGRFLYHFSSRPGPRFTCPGFRPCGALRRCPRTSSRVNAASDRPSPKVTEEGRASARLATANNEGAL